MEFWLQKNGGSREDIAIIRDQVKRLRGKISTLAMRAAAPRQTFVQIRGDFLRKGEPVQPTYNRSGERGRQPPSRKLNALDLARWLTSADNPLTARVTVNREWQKFFGRGLVETENDFGLQGSFPPTRSCWIGSRLSSRKRLELQEVPQAHRDEPGL